MPPDPDSLITDATGRTFRRGDWVTAGRIALPRCACLASWAPAIGDSVRLARPRTWPLDQRRWIGEVVGPDGDRWAVTWTVGGPRPAYAIDELLPLAEHVAGCATGEPASTSGR